MVNVPRLLIGTLLWFGVACIVHAQCDIATEADRQFTALDGQRRLHGAAVVFVRNDAPPEERLYGDGVNSRTLWRAASTTKALTAIAIMQLAEQGKLSLDADAASFLPPGILRNRFSLPVTVRDLLLHRGGVDDRFIGDGFRSGAQPLMTEVVAQRPLDVVYAPGMIEFYSNYGYALLGAIIEKASGERYEQYVQNHILDALGMKDSTVQQPLPPELVTRLAGGRFVYQHAASAAGLTTSADDLSRLLVAILHHGSPILSAASFDQMAPPTEVGVRLVRGFGFFSGNEHGHPLIAATGDIEEFHTLLAAFPDLHLGFAVVASSRSGAATTNFFRAVVNDCVAPVVAGATIARPFGPVVSHDGTSPFSGLYRTVRYPHHELSKTFVLLDLTHVSDRGDGTLYIDGRRYDPTGAGRFRPADGGATVSFVATADGRQFLSRPDSPSLEKIHWWETGWFAIAIYFAALAICLVGLVKTRHLARAICAVALVYSLGWLVTLLLYGADNLILGIPLALRILLFMAWLLPICLFLSLIAAAKLKSMAVRLIPFAIAQLLFIAWYWHVYWP